jgi:hypothetical protein
MAGTVQRPVELGDPLLNPHPSTNRAASGGTHAKPQVNPLNRLINLPRTKSAQIGYSPNSSNRAPQLPADPIHATLDNQRAAQLRWRPQVRFARLPNQPA